jgi:UDP-glucose 4-epimerase
VSDAATFVKADAGDTKTITDLISRHGINAVIHFAGHIVVPESVSDPMKYYRNNVVDSQQLIDACYHNGIRIFVFSSTAAVYGAPKTVPINENASLAPINPYGNTKFITELMLQDLSSATATTSAPFRFVALRYFNVAGARVGGGLGQSTPNATHLIKIACQAALGLRSSITVYGRDYDTVDGTCIRDYIHVDDLASAHLHALDYLATGGASVSLNCGYGHGYSVYQVLDTLKKVSGVDFAVEIGERRPGDPAELVADSERIRNVLGWLPRYDDLELICRTAWQWEAALQEKLSSSTE